MWIDSALKFVKGIWLLGDRRGSEELDPLGLPTLGFNNTDQRFGTCGLSVDDADEVLVCVPRTAQEYSKSPSAVHFVTVLGG